MLTVLNSIILYMYVNASWAHGAYNYMYISYNARSQKGFFNKTIQNF